MFVHGIISEEDMKKFLNMLHLQSYSHDKAYIATQGMNIKNVAFSII